jgi:thermitase
MPSLRLTGSRAARALALAALGLVSLAPAAVSSRREAAGADRRTLAPGPTAVVGYRSASALRRVLREHRGTVVRTIPALAAGSVTNGDGIAGFGGDARLLVVQASRSAASFSDFDEAAAIVWAVDHGARILNLSLGGTDTSTTERRAVDYAVRHGALLVTAIGNTRTEDNAVEYPAALVQPVGSNGRGGVGLSVGASDETGLPADFSNTGSHLSLLAPGVNVLSALSSTGSNAGYVKVPLPGSASGQYAFASGTSFAAPEVSGAAALVWAANPALSAQQVASVLKQTASNHGTWTPDAGYGVVDVAAAVQQARVTRAACPRVSRPARGARRC